eukprot:1993078-Amphidinium_carterae.2
MDLDLQTSVGGRQNWPSIRHSRVRSPHTSAMQVKATDKVNVKHQRLRDSPSSRRTLRRLMFE